MMKANPSISATNSAPPIPMIASCFAVRSLIPVIFSLPKVKSLTLKIRIRLQARTDSPPTSGEAVTLAVSYWASFHAAL